MAEPPKHDLQAGSSRSLVVLELAGELATRYSEQPVARAVVATAAVFFPPLLPIDAAFGAWGAQLGNERLRQSMDEIREAIQRVEGRLDEGLTPDELVD